MEIKKTIYSIWILTIIFSFISCNKNDDEVSREVVDQIIGSWSLTSKTISGVEQITTTCPSTITFNQNGTYINNDYIVESNGDCTIDPNTTSSVFFYNINGTWQAHNDDNYSADGLVANKKKFFFSVNTFYFITGDGSVINTYTKN